MTLWDLFVSEFPTTIYWEPVQTIYYSREIISHNMWAKIVGFLSVVLISTVDTARLSCLLKSFNFNKNGAS